MLQQQKIPAKIWPLIQIQTKDLRDSQDILRNSEYYEWLVFPSPNAVTSFFHGLTQQNISHPEWTGKKMAAVGKKTAQTLFHYGVQEIFVPETQQGSSLTKHIQQQKLQKKVLLCMGEQSFLPEEFQKEKIPFDKIVCYQTLSTPPEERDPLKLNKSIVFFASPSAVESFLRTHSFEKVKATIAIGATTAQKIRQHFSGPVQIAQEPSEEGIFQCILQYYQQENLFKRVFY